MWSAGLIVVGLITGCERSPSEHATHRTNQAINWFEPAGAGGTSPDAGVHFIHEVETSGKYLFSESIGSGGAFFDFDNDGRLDIYLIHNVNPSGRATNRLFQQRQL